MFTIKREFMSKRGVDVEVDKNGDLILHFENDSAHEWAASVVGDAELESDSARDHLHGQLVKALNGAVWLDIVTQS